MDREDADLVIPQRCWGQHGLALEPGQQRAQRVSGVETRDVHEPVDQCAQDRHAVQPILRHGVQRQKGRLVEQPKQQLARRLAEGALVPVSQQLESARDVGEELGVGGHGQVAPGPLHGACEAQQLAIRGRPQRRAEHAQQRGCIVGIGNRPQQGLQLEPLAVLERIVPALEREGDAPLTQGLGVEMHLGERAEEDRDVSVGQPAGFVLARDPVRDNLALCASGRLGRPRLVRRTDGPELDPWAIVGGITSGLHALEIGLDLALQLGSGLEQ
jgi:hypothetical protein